MSDTRIDLPPTSSPNFLEKVRETLSVYLGNRGDSLNRGVTVGDLYDSGIVTLTPGYIKGGRVAPISGPGQSIGYTPDNTPPPTPTGFAATAAISNLLVECDIQSYTGGHGHAKSALYGIVWSSGTLPMFADAQLISEFPGSVHAYATNPATTWHLWLKWISADGVASVMPAGGTHGVAVTTGQNVEKLVKAMTGPGNPFKIVTEPITLADGTVVPVGTYTADAYIHNSQITNAKIANLAVDNAKIASLSVSKLTAGAMAVGQYIQSTNYVPNNVGWRISADGTAELANAVVRGAVYATAGHIGNNTIDASGMQSAGFVQGSSGWRLNSNGSLYAASGSFKGDITGASGNFSGNLSGANISGATGNFAGTLYGADISGVNGTFSGTLRANIVEASNITPNSATNFENIVVSVQDGVWTPHDFIMHETGAVVLLSSLPFAEYVLRIEMDGNYNTHYFEGKTLQNYFYLSQGVHTLWVWASRDSPGAVYPVSNIMLKSYR